MDPAALTSRSTHEYPDPEQGPVHLHHGTRLKYLEAILMGINLSGCSDYGAEPTEGAALIFPALN